MECTIPIMAKLIKWSSVDMNIGVKTIKLNFNGNDAINQLLPSAWASRGGRGGHVPHKSSKGDKCPPPPPRFGAVWLFIRIKTIFLFACQQWRTVVWSRQSNGRAQHYSQTILCPSKSNALSTPNDGTPLLVREVGGDVSWGNLSSDTSVWDLKISHMKQLK